MSTIQRITGSNSGLDVDSLVKQSLTRYQNKVDKETQNKMVLQYQQDQYKQIMSDASSFYDKYFDVLKTGNLLSTSTYNTISFTESDTDKTKVTAKGFAGADASNYKITTTQIATKASHTFKATDFTKNDGTDKISFSMNGKSIEDVTIKSNSQTDMQSAVDELNTKLSKAGINASAKYSQFSNGIVIESGNMGGNVSFQADLNLGSGSPTKYTGQNAEGVIVKGTESYTFNQASNVVFVDNVEFDLKAPTMAATTPANLADVTDLTDLTDLKDDLSDLTHLQETDSGVTTSTTTNGTTTTTTMTSSDGKTTTVKTTDGTNTTLKTTLTTVNADKSTTINTTTTNPDGTVINTTTTTNADGTTTTKSVQKNTNGTGPVVIKNDTTTTTISGNVTTTTYGALKTVSDSISNIKTTTNSSGTKTVTNADGSKKTTDVNGKETDTSADGKTKTTTFGDIITVTVTGNDGSKTITTNQNTTQIVTNITASGVLTKTTSTDSGSTTTPVADSPATLTGTTDVAALKDKIVSFVNDYNTLLQEINTKLYEKRDKSYMPLTDDQKKNMTDSQITAWEKKAQTGLLKGDNDLQRIAREMKSTMSTVMSGSGLYLEEIGISPVNNYAEKNGLYTVDESKLTTALEEKSGNIKDLFTKDTGNDDTSGIFVRLKSSLYSEFKTSTSSLSKKAGYNGSTTEFDNQLTNSINEKTTLIKKLNTQLSDREDALYKKYSNLEKLMEQMNSQQSSLAKMLGQS